MTPVETKPPDTGVDLAPEAVAALPSARARDHPPLALVDRWRSLLGLGGWPSGPPATTSSRAPGRWPWGSPSWSVRACCSSYIVASLFRVTWGFGLAVLVGVPFGLFLGWFRMAYQAFNPIIQVLRPISPIAWIPLAILWFGVSDARPGLPDLPGQRVPGHGLGDGRRPGPPAGLPPGRQELRAGPVAQLFRPGDPAGERSRRSSPGSGSRWGWPGWWWWPPR